MHANARHGLLKPIALALLSVVLNCQKPAPRRPAIDASLLLQSLIASKRPPADIESVKRAAAAGDSCRYAEAAARAVLDANLHALVPPLLEAAPKTCTNSSALLGERAEALARAGDTDLPKQTAHQALLVDGKNAYAELALARLSYDQNQMTLCSEHAGQALAFGRGAEAERWLGRTSLALSKFDEAAAHYQNLLKTNPNDTEASFSAAVCNDKLGRYAAAREGFLQTLRIDPKHIEARKYLVLITLRAGAKAEAQHHLDKLAEQLPKDSPLLAQLQALFPNNGADAGAPQKP